MRRFNVVISKDDGGVEMYPMKEWLRQNSAILPGINPSTRTSHELARALARLGWSTKETPTEVHLIKPGEDGRTPSVEDIIGSSEDDGIEDTVPPGEASFTLEYQLRDFIAQNLDTITIDGRKLRLHVDDTGRDGIEFPTAVGPIDILARDKTGSFFVFELKRASSPDKAVGQLARYMGWVKQTIGKGQEVHGVIVAKNIGPKLRYAVSVVPNVSVFEYEVKFLLRPAHEIEAPAA